MKQALRNDKRDWIDRITIKAEASAAHGHMEGVYGATNQLRNTPNRSLDAVKDKDGKLLTTEEHVMKRSEEHFSDILDRPLPETPADIEEAMDGELDITTEYITMEKIKSTIREVASGKPQELMQSQQKY